MFTDKICIFNTNERARIPQLKEISEYMMNTINN